MNRAEAAQLFSKKEETFRWNAIQEFIWGKKGKQ